ncbi:hypothetical protein SAMN05444405_11061 [Bacteroides luti]|uniref:Uncharacterized protein n=1 Tax=Bacteroides luti TaxID=1297750 RepID=A0A1M5CJ48_9BACE|nr:hypothetical protein SAMN05444405_11061 [Bacteroides luti]
MKNGFDVSFIQIYNIKKRLIVLLLMFKALFDIVFCKRCTLFTKIV